MEWNIIRNYEEITNIGVKQIEKYHLKKLSLIDEEDRDACLRFLTAENKHLQLCHNFYSSDHIKTIIEYADNFIYFHKERAVDDIVAFSIVKFMRKKRGKIMNILLLCAIPNTKKFGQMIANAVYNLAKNRGCRFIYTSPRTELLRETFLKYGFEPIFGIKDKDEVLEKEIDSKSLILSNPLKTRKCPRNKSPKCVSLTSSNFIEFPM